MPEVEENKQDLVDIDTSGPGAEIEIEEPKEKVEVVNETVEEETKPVEATDTEETKEEKKEASDEKQEKKEELEDYSEGVKKRIAKLTKKWREAERQREAALEYATGVQDEHSKLKTRVSNLEPSYVNAMEGKVISVGGGARNENGQVVALDVKKGDRILFGKWSGTEVKIDGKELLIMKESDIMGIIEK